MPNKEKAVEKFVFSEEEKRLYKYEIRRIKRNPDNWEEGVWCIAKDGRPIRSFRNKRSRSNETLVFEYPTPEEWDRIWAGFDKIQEEHKQRRRNNAVK